MPKRILVVDDDRNIGQILHASFSSKGYETIVSRNGEDALAKFAEAHPDLVLLDVLLPKMNGWDVCRKLKDTEIGAQTPIILMSAVYKNYKMQQDAVRKYGADDFVEKPFQLSKLLDLVESLIGAGDGPLVDESVPEAGVAEPAEDALEERPAPKPISLEGNLESIGFAELVHDVYVMGKSGFLLVRRGDVEKEIAIKNGYPVSVRTTIAEEYFGNFLVRKRKITPEQRDESLERAKTSGRLQGTVLIEMEVMTPHEVVKYLKLQMREKLFEIFGWLEGTYRFTEDPEVQGDITTLDMSTANVINEGVHQHYDLDRLEPTVDNWRERYIRPGANLHYRFQEIEFTRREEIVFDLIDGTRTVSEVLENMDLDTERSYQILFTLIVCEMAELADETMEVPETIIDRQVGTDAFDAPPDEPEEETPPPTVQSAPPPEPAPTPPPTSAKTRAPQPAPPAEEEEEEDEAEEAPLTESATEGGEEMRQRVLRVYNRVSQGNHFQILGVNENPTEHEVRVAYHKMAKEFHPDRFFGKASDDVRAQVEEIFRRATEAYENLNTQKKIADYVGKMETEEEAPKTDSRIEGVKKIILAEQHFQNGKQYLKDRRYSRAANEFRLAMETSPNEAEYVAFYGWALYNVPRERDASEDDKKLFVDQTAGDMQFNGREALNRAIAVNPRGERAYLFLGAIYKSQGLKEFAEKQYEKALICNPSCIEALRELRLIKLAEQKKTAKKSLLDRINIFKK